MKKELEDFYFKVALEIAREEHEAATRSELQQLAEFADTCIVPTRAEVIARSSQLTPQEVEHMRECRMCARLVQNLSPAPIKERTPAARWLLTALKQYGRTSEQLARELLGIAQANARIFSHGIGEWAFEDDTATAIPRVFEMEGLSVQLDLREETKEFVVEVGATDEALYGQLLTVVLLGGTGQELRVPVRLDGRKGRKCYGQGAILGSGSDVVKRLGPIIVPLVLFSSESLTS